MSELFLAFWDHAQVHYRKDGVPTSEISDIKGTNDRSSQRKPPDRDPIREARDELSRHAQTRIPQAISRTSGSVRQSLVVVPISSSVVHLFFPAAEAE